MRPASSPARLRTVSLTCALAAVALGTPPAAAGPLSFWTSPACQSVDDQGPPHPPTTLDGGVRFYQDIPFCTINDSVALGPYTIKLDVYVPLIDQGSQPPPLPALLDVHGARENSDKSATGTESLPLAQSGFVVFSPNYRLVCDPNNPPDPVVQRGDTNLCVAPSGTGAAIKPVLDVAQALLWVRRHPVGAGAALWSIDPTRVGVFGTSAGGNLAEMVAVDAQAGAGIDAGAVPEVAGGFSGEQEMALAKLSPDPNVATKAVKYIGCKLADCPGDWDQASPISYVTSTTPPSTPPSYFANGTDEQIPAREAIDMDAAIRAAGAISYLRLVPGTNHASALDFVDVAPGVTTLQEVASFLHTFLDVNPSATLSVAVASSPTTLQAGQSLTVDIDVSNGGPVFAMSTQARIPLPWAQGVAATVTSTNGQAGSCAGSPTLVCNVGSIPGGEAANVQLHLTPMVPGTLSPAATASAPHSSDATGTSSAVTVTTNPAVLYSDVTDGGVSAATLKQPITKTVQWDFSAANTSPHSVISTTVPVCDQAGVAPGGFAQCPFPAGVYVMAFDTSPAASQKVSVPVVVTPATGSTLTTFTVKAAMTQAAVGYVYHMQWKAPGSTTWTNVASPSRAPTASFGPKSVGGTYAFRARLEKTGVGVSAWSPLASITIS